MKKPFIPPKAPTIYFKRYDPFLCTEEEWIKESKDHALAMINFYMGMVKREYEKWCKKKK